MIFVSWNCQGVGNRATVNHTKDFIFKGGIEAVCFMETKAMNNTRLVSMTTKHGFDKSFSVDPLAFVGDLLLVWKKESIRLEVIAHSTQVVHCVVMKGMLNEYRISFAYVRPN